MEAKSKSKSKSSLLVEYYRGEIERRSPPKSQEDYFMINGYQALINEITRAREDVRH